MISAGGRQHSRRSQPLAPGTRLRKLYLLVLFALLAPAAAHAQAAADSAAIRRVALDYIEGWYTGDAARMERALHPDLAKRIVESDARNGGSVLGHMTAA
jgi:hypothetical protein